MTKTVSFTIGNPITAIRKMNAKRVIRKLNKQIEKRQNKIQKLNEKFFTDSTQNIVIGDNNGKTHNTVIVKPTETDKLKAKMLTLDNKIIAKSNNKNSNLHLDKGRIDEVIEMLQKTPTKDLVVSTKAGKTRVFLNSPNPLKIARVTKFLKNHGGYILEVA